MYVESWIGKKGHIKCYSISWEVRNLAKKQRDIVAGSNRIFWGINYKKLEIEAWLQSANTKPKWYDKIVRVKAAKLINKKFTNKH